jgi:uncharacterized membrane protein
MQQILVGVAVWLHALGTVMMIGHYLLLSLVYLPVLAKYDGTILREISKRSRRWLYASLIVFIVTGIYLMFTDPNYLGLANFSNLWGVLMLVKHLLILAMIVMGFWFNAILRVGSMLGSNSSAGQVIDRFRRHANLMATCGLLVLLLTALAQAQ